MATTDKVSEHRKALIDSNRLVGQRLRDSNTWNPSAMCSLRSWWHSDSVREPVWGFESALGPRIADTSNPIGAFVRAHREACGITGSRPPAHTPTTAVVTIMATMTATVGTPGRTRTCNQRIRSPKNALRWRASPGARESDFGLPVRWQVPSCTAMRSGGYILGFNAAPTDMPNSGNFPARPLGCGYLRVGGEQPGDLGGGDGVSGLESSLFRRARSRWTELTYVEIGTKSWPRQGCR